MKPVAAEKTRRRPGLLAARAAGLRLAVMALAQGAMPNAAAQATDLNLGVLAFEGKPQAAARWQATAEHLSKALAPQRVVLRPLTYEELNEAIRTDAVQAVLTNPEHHVALQRAYGLRPIATLATAYQGLVLESMGGVVFTRADSPVRQLEDARGRRIAAVGLYSLGGFLAQAREFKLAGVNLRGSDVASLSFTDVPHDKVVTEVLEGRADIGLVRTGVLEAMARRGAADLTQLRVLRGLQHAQFPFQASTPLYPEWPLSVSPRLSGRQARDLMVALQAIRPEDSAARQGRYHGFLPVADYTPVVALMTELGVRPKVTHPQMWKDLWSDYEEIIEFALGTLGAALLLLLVYFMAQNRKQRRLTRLVREAQANLEVSATAFDSQVGLLVLDPDSRIIKVNEAFSQLLGYSEDELRGQTTAGLRSETVGPGAMRALWAQLQSGGRWQGEGHCRHKDGREVICMVTVKALARHGGPAGFVASFTDLTALKAAETAMRQIAYFDSLTGLPNRRLFLERLGQALAEGGWGALMFIDLDHFKLLNDTHGHVYGDKLLQTLSQRLLDELGDDALVARLGGDEFVVMVTGLPAEEQQALDQALCLASRVHQCLLRPCRLQASTDGDSAAALTYHCTGSVGLSLFGTQAEAVTEVLKRADVAMYQAKQAGRNTVRAYERSVQRAMDRKGQLSADLSAALARNELSLHYQLQVNAAGLAVGGEVLMRWQHPVHGPVSPLEFITLAEESGAIVEMGHWLLDTACSTLSRWASMPALRQLTLSINVSPRQMIESDFVDQVRKAIEAHGVAASKLIFEITEGIVMQNTNQVLARMHEVCALGIGFAVDDFGTGYSSLSYLQRLPLRQVKIDRSFVHDMLSSPQSQAIVRAIIALARSMHLVIVAEGVETAEQQAALVNMGCDELQGYWVALPVPLEAFEAAQAGPLQLPA